MQVLIKPNIQTGEPEPNIIDGKYHDKDNFFLNNALSYVKLN